MIDEIIKNSESEHENYCENSNEQEIINENEEILKKLEEVKNELNIQNERFLRLAAEYDNYRKRSEKDKILIYNDAKAKTVSEILSIADCIERAIESSQDADDEYQKGLSMLNEQFIATLSKLGVSSFGSVGDKFNPELHNAISHIEDDKLDENVIAQVFQRGYMLGDKIIRHAMVSVAN